MGSLLTVAVSSALLTAAVFETVLYLNTSSSHAVSPVQRPISPEKMKSHLISSIRGRKLQAQPDDTAVSAYHCARMEAWGDVCQYRNMCYDGSYWMLFDESGDDNVESAAVIDGWQDLLEGTLYPVVTPVPDPAVLPFNGGALQAKIVKPSTRSAPGRTVTWSSHNIWLLPMDLPLANLWYYGSRILPMFRARLMNNTRILNPTLPTFASDDIIYIPSVDDQFTGQWFETVLEVASGGKGTVEFRNKWGAQWNSSNWVCFNRAVASGTFAAVVPDPETGRDFRDAVYAKHGLQQPKEPVKKVLFWLRPLGDGRSIRNQDDMFALATRYNLSYTVITESPGSFREQLELFAAHGVVVAPHGAGLMNMLFFPRGSSVVEIYPYHLHHNLYPTLAAHMQIGHYGVYNFNNTDIVTREKDVDFMAECDSQSVMDININSATCRNIVMNYMIDVNLRDFEAALVNAVEHSGHRIRFRNFHPVPNNATETGWS